MTTLSGYIEQLQELIDDDPTLADVEVMYAVDDEGNEYSAIHNEPMAAKVISTDGMVPYRVDNIYWDDQEVEDAIDEGYLQDGGEFIRVVIVN